MVVTTWNMNHSELANPLTFGSNNATKTEHTRKSAMNAIVDGRRPDALMIRPIALGFKNDTLFRSMFASFHELDFGQCLVNSL